MDQKDKEKSFYERKDRALNRALAKQLIYKFKNSEGLRYELDDHSFKISNDVAVLHRENSDEDSYSTKYYISQTGEKMYGANSIKVLFESSHEDFKNSLKQFFVWAGWVKPKENAKISDQER